MPDQIRHSKAHEAQILSDPEDLARKESFNVVEQFRMIAQLVETNLRLKTQFRLRPSHLLQLHRVALEGISQYAGNWRPADIEIGGSRHKPPSANEVPEKVEELCEYVNDKWTEKSPIHLAAYVMWRLNWIHPFTDGNGRTSRALSYMVLCIRLGYLLPGRLTIPEQIEQGKTPYYKALEAADSAWIDGDIDLREMKELIGSMLARQLLATLEESDVDPSREKDSDAGATGDKFPWAGTRGLRHLVPITGVSVSGWKSIAEKVEIRLGALTLLAGANSSGKSSLIQPILMLKQTLEAPYDPGALLLDGTHIRFTEAAQFLSKAPMQGNGELSVYVSSDSEMIGSTFEKIEGLPIDVKETRFRSGTREVRYSRGLPPSDIEYELLADQKALYNSFIKSDSSLQLSIDRNRCFLEPKLALRISGPQGELAVALPNAGATELIESIRSIIHLPGLRGNPERTYPLVVAGSTFPGPFPNYTASLIKRWMSSEDSSKINDLNKFLRELELTSAVVAHPVDETRVELRVGRQIGSKGKDDVSIADVGLAVSQVLPILVALIVAERGQLVFIEQPELHLHPRAQVKLAELFVEAMDRGVRVLLETHSSLLLLAIQTHVAKSEILPSSLKLYWFRRNESGETCITGAEIDETGGFGEWPEDFGSVLMSAEHEYLTAAESLLTRKANAGQKSTS